MQLGDYKNSVGLSINLVFHGNLTSQAKKIRKDHGWPQGSVFVIIRYTVNSLIKYTKRPSLYKRGLFLGLRCLD